MREHLQFFIDGAWVDPAEGVHPLDVINPATEESCGRIAMGSAADVDRAVKAARKAFVPWSETSREERGAVLERIVAEYQKRFGDMAQAITEEMGAPAWLSQRAQAAMGVAHFSTAIEILKGYSFEEPRGKTTIAKEPIGVCGFITPWNWPVNQIACKVAPALAVGCTVVLKTVRGGAVQCDHLRRDPAGGRRARGRVQSRQRRRPDRRRGDQLAPRRGHGQLHRLDPRGHRGGQGGRRHRQARAPGARRQEPQHRAGGRRPAEGRHRRRGLSDDELGPELQRPHPHARARRQDARGRRDREGGRRGPHGRAPRRQLEAGSGRLRGAVQQDTGPDPEGRRRGAPPWSPAAPAGRRGWRRATTSSLPCSPT